MLLFVHDHKFRRVNGEFYTTGGLNNETIQRYTRLDEEVVIYARIIDEQNRVEQWSQIKEKVIIKGDNTVSGFGLDEAIKSADSVIIRLPSFLGNKAYRLVKKYKKPFMIEMVGCSWDSLWNHGIKGKIVAPFCFVLTRKIVRDAPFVLYVTEKFLQRRYPTKGRNVGCSDVVINDSSSVILENRIKKIQTRNSKWIIGTTAAVNVRYKGQEYVIKALALLKKKGITGFEYQLAGNGDNSYLASIARKAGVSDQVVFLGGIPHEEIYKWLDSIDIYIQPSFQEGLPRALVEAQSRALPCFGSTTGGIPELLHDECIFNRRGDMSNSIAEKLLHLSVEKEIEYASFDFNKSRNYLREILDDTRKAFYDEFMDYTRNFK